MANLLKDAQNHRLNSDKDEVWFEHHLKIDNTDLEPDQVAENHDQELKAQESEVSETVLMDYRNALESLPNHESKRELAEAERFINSSLRR